MKRRIRYDPKLKRCVEVTHGAPDLDPQAPTIRVSGDGRFISQSLPPNLGRGTAHEAPHYIDEQPAFTSRRQAQDFAAAHGMAYTEDRPTPRELRTELRAQAERKRQARNALRPRV